MVTGYPVQRLFLNFHPLQDISVASEIDKYPLPGVNFPFGTCE